MGAADLLNFLKKQKALPAGLFKPKKGRAADEAELQKMKLARAVNKIRRKRFSQGSFSELNNTLREFLKEKFRIRYEFTEPEMEKELRKKRLRKELRLQAAGIAASLDNVVYSETKLKKKDLTMFANQIKELVKEL